MRRTIIIAIAAAVIAGMLAVPATAGKKKSRLVNTTVTYTAPSPPTGSTTFLVSGRLKAASTCEQRRTVRINVTGPDGVRAIPEIALVTPPSGLFAGQITLPEKTADSPPATPKKPLNYSLSVDVDKTNRKAPKGSNYRRLVCIDAETTPTSIVVTK